MPIKAPPRFSSWSYSRLSDYESCPRKAKYKHLDKLPEAAGAALERGSAIHKEAEAYVRGRLTPLPESLSRFPEEFELLRQAPGLVCEQQLAVDAKWQPCGWFDRSAWLRVVVDVAHDGPAGFPARRVVVDYKTGKVRPSNVDQLDLYCLVALSHCSEINLVEAALWYLDQGEIVSRSLVRAEQARVRAAWMKRSAPMLADETFVPKPGNACRWCSYRHDADGPCEY